MGISCAPRLFTKLITPIYAYLNKSGNTCFTYLDDSFIYGFSKEECAASTTRHCDLLTQLGFKVHLEKSSLIPSQKVKFLAFYIDYSDDSFSAGTKKVECNRTM